MTERNVEVLFFFCTCSNSLEVHGSKHSKEGPVALGFSGGVYPMPDAQQDQVRPPRIPGLTPFLAKIVVSQVEVDEGRRGLQKHRNGLAKNET